MNLKVNLSKMLVKRLLVATAVLAGVLIAGGVIFAATSQITPVQHTATGVDVTPPPPPPTYTFELFEQDGITPLVQPIAWGEIVIGTPETKTVVAKSTGTGAVTISVDTSEVPAGWTMMAPAITGLTSGSSAEMSITLSTTVTGMESFSTDFAASY